MCPFAAPKIILGEVRVTVESPLPSNPVNIWPGQPYPLGATYDGSGTNFAIFSEAAELVELCLFDGDREARVNLPEETGNVWHGYLPDVADGGRYGYRVHGPWALEQGIRCN